jgi:protein-L-isoaspartate(D-aspartate) O-methyltransferase
MRAERRRFVVASALLPLAERALAQDAPGREHRRMLEQIDALMQQTAAETGRPRLSPRVRKAIEQVPRHRFVPETLRDAAYANRPLPIGEGQTISQPFIVALMTELLDPQPTDRVLEVGTGSGYQAAVLAECVAQVYTIEIVPTLGARAAAVLRDLGYRNVHARVGDGYQGWPEEAPFDGIVVTAAPDQVPQPLIEQLARGGRLVIPVGPREPNQELLLITKDASGQAVTTKKLEVRFVPLTRAPGAR